MSEARKCDLCKRCFDPMEETGKMARYLIIVQNGEDMVTARERDKQYPFNDLNKFGDLCPECTKKFMDFLSGAAASVKERKTIDELTEEVKRQTRKRATASRLMFEAMERARTAEEQIKTLTAELKNLAELNENRRKWLKELEAENLRLRAWIDGTDAMKEDK